MDCAYYAAPEVDRNYLALAMVNGLVPEREGS